MIRILLVDDEHRLRRSMALRLQMRGYEVLEAASGEEAVQLAREDGRIGVLVLDLKMPGMGGEQALRHIRLIRPELPIIMLTGMGEGGAPPSLVQSGASAILEKPGSLEDMIEAVESAHRGVRKHGEGRAFAGAPDDTQEQERGE